MTKKYEVGLSKFEEEMKQFTIDELLEDCKIEVDHNYTGILNPKYIGDVKRKKGNRECKGKYVLNGFFSLHSSSIRNR